MIFAGKVLLTLHFCSRARAFSLIKVLYKITKLCPKSPWLQP